MSASSEFAVHRALLPHDSAAPVMHELGRQMLPIGSCWGSLHPDILHLVAARLPASGDYGPVNCATRVCKAWRGPFIARVCQSREGVLQPRGSCQVFNGGTGRLLIPPESWTRMISAGGLSCLDLSRLPWAEHSRHHPEELLKAAEAYAVGIAQLAPAGLASLVLWLGDGCEAVTPGFVNRHYAPLLLRTLPLLKGLTSLEVPSLSWEGLGPLVSALRQLLAAANDCKLSELTLNLRVPTYHDVIGSFSAAEDREYSYSEDELLCKAISKNFHQDPEIVQQAMHPFKELRLLLEEHPDLSVSLCAKVCSSKTDLDGSWVLPYDLPMGETLETLGGAVTELELRNIGFPPGSPNLLRGVKRLVMVEVDPGPEDPWIGTDSVLCALAALPALEELVMDVGRDAVSVGKFVRVPEGRPSGMTYRP